MKIVLATFTIQDRGQEYLVGFIYSSPGIPFEVQVKSPTGEVARLENTHRRWKPCQTHATEAVKLAVERPVSIWSQQRMEAKPAPRPLGLYAGNECRRCSECEGCPITGWTTRISAAKGMPRISCKHCEALGDECEACGGSGEGTTADDLCVQCGGEGVILDKESIA